MLKTIVWSDNSKEDITNLIEYLQDNWSQQIANDYIDLIEEIVKQISDHPKLYPIIHTRFKIRKCVVSKHNSIYYREKKDVIEIVNVFDNRQHPKKLKFKI